MDIIVPIKQVPDTAEVEIDPETGTLIRDGVEAIVNPFDENAIEAALQLREEHSGRVTVITMGPAQAEDALRQGIAMGADDAYLLSDKRFAGADTLATSYTLARAVRYIGHFDLIICGKQAFDGDTGQVPPGLAEHLGIPQLMYAIDIEIHGQQVRARRMVGDHFEVTETPMPCLLSVVKHINEPRHAGLKGVMKARKTEIPVLTADEINADAERCGILGSATSVIETFAPTHEHKTKRLEGDVSEMARDLVSHLRDSSVI